MWDGGDRIRNFEERKEENWYSPRHMTNEPQKYVTFESEFYNLKLELLCLNCKTIFHLHFAELNNIVNYMCGLFPKYCSLGTTFQLPECMPYWPSKLLWLGSRQYSILTKSVLHFVGL